VAPASAAGIIALLAALFLAATAWGPIRRWRRRARIAADEARMEPKPVVY
jgi:hypothetical protein